MRVLVCGSRVWPDADVIVDILKDLQDQHGDELVIIHGGAKGADKLAHEYCLILGIKVEVFLADWTRYGRGAGYHRNTKMLNTGPDLVVAFHSENSPGTGHTIRQSQDRGVPLLVVLPRSSYDPI